MEEKDREREGGREREREKEIERKRERERGRGSERKRLEGSHPTVDYLPIVYPRTACTMWVRGGVLDVVGICDSERAFKIMI